MSQTSRREVLWRLRQRYRGRGKQGRSQLVTEACELCGYSRKHAIKVLNGKLPVGGAPRPRGGRRAKYGAAHLPTVKAVWLAAEQPCGKRLVGALPLWLPFYERQHGQLSAVVRREVLELPQNSMTP